MESSRQDEQMGRISERVQEQKEKPKQMDLFEENFLKREVRAEYKLIGQVFDTYWLVEFQDKLYIIDQHAAHERVLYERTLQGMKTREFTSQYLSPPIILSLSMQEAQLLNENLDLVYQDLDLRSNRLAGKNMQYVQCRTICSALQKRNC